MNVRKIIWVTFQRAGFHRYPNAPEDVGYLALEHRHLFKCRVSISVNHNDREIEFHQFLKWLENLYDKSSISFNNKSCEMIAEDLYDLINQKYPNRRVIIEISEDGECGCTLEWDNE